MTGPGSDGELPPDFREWQRGVTYTVRPEMLSPPREGKEYRITAAVRRKTGKDRPFSDYGPLYQRASAIAAARITQLANPQFANAPHTWIHTHGWRAIEVGEHQLLFAFLTMGWMLSGTYDPKPAGQPLPTEPELHEPGGASLEELRHNGPQRSHEMYIDFDHRDPSCAHPEILLFSYGESVERCDAIDFAPYLARGEALARFHYELLEHEAGGGTGSFQIVRREWWCVTDPNLVTVHIYYRI